jgi:hypothetical protein
VISYAVAVVVVRAVRLSVVVVIKSVVVHEGVLDGSERDLCILALSGSGILDVGLVVLGVVIEVSAGEVVEESVELERSADILPISVCIPVAVISTTALPPTT